MGPGKLVNNKYRLKKLIGEGDISTVWLAGYKDQDIAIKILKKEAISSRLEDVIRFKNEATSVININSPHLVKVFEIGEEEQSIYMVMEYIQGKNLQQLLASNVFFSIAQTVAIVRQICEGLKAVHGAGIIHRNIKPGNILVQPTRDENREILHVRLNDTGLAQIKEFGKKDDHEMVRTLCYMSPEQSGAMKRLVDERSDLYSLGIVFYELLTGILPFQGNSVSSIIHQHIAKTPERPSLVNKDIPPVLERIVLKMLEKEPENRYQSADGLISDLDRYVKGSFDFPLGTNDAMAKLSWQTRLTGVDAKYNQLTELFDRSLRGKGNFCLISGEAGIGKTRLLEELRSYVYRNKGLFINGKCFSGKNKVPYGPFKDALDLYIKQYLQYSETRKAEINKKLREAVGPLGGVVLQFNPQLQAVIGYYPEPAELETVKETTRFFMVIKQLICRLAGAEGALVIGIEDLHWSDTGTLQLLEELIDEIKEYPVLLVGTYRDDEIGENHVLKKFINKAEINHSVLTIHLKRFDRGIMHEFITGLLQSSNIPEHFSDYVYNSSRGNPLFAVELLKQLVDQGALIRTVDGYTIRQKLFGEDISSNIIDILINKISLLSPRENDILAYAAVIGKSFDINLLFQLSPFKIEELVSIVDKAMDLKLLERDLHDRDKMLFAHDRIRDAFYFNLGETIREKLHLQVAAFLEKSFHNGSSNLVFDLAHHYIEAKHKEKMLEYAYLAGIKAKENYANEEALRYLLLVVELLKEKNQAGFELWLSCQQNIGEAYLAVGKNNEAIRVFNEVLSSSKNRFQIVNAYNKISQAYYQLGDWNNVEFYARQALKLLGEKLPTGRFKVTAGILKELIVHFFHCLFPFYYRKRSRNKNRERYELISSIYLVLVRTFTLSNVLILIYSTLRMLNLTESKLGYSRELVWCLGGYASMLMALPLFHRAEAFLEQSASMAEQINKITGYAPAEQLRGYLYEWQGEYKASIKQFESSLDKFKDLGDIKEYMMSLNGLVHGHYYLGDFKTMKEINDQYLSIATSTADTYAVHAAYIYYLQYYRETGNFEKAAHYGFEALASSYENKDLFNYCSAHIEMGFLHLEKEEPREAVKVFEKCKSLSESNNFLKQYTVLLYYGLAEAYMLDYRRSCDYMSPKEKRTYINQIKKACRAALKKNRNWSTHYGGALRAYARFLALTGKYRQANRLFTKALHHFARINRHFEVGKTLYLYGIMLEEQGKIKESNAKLEQAYNIFKTLEIPHYRSKIAALFGFEENRAGPEERFSSQMSSTRRLASLIALSREISSVLNLEELIDKVISLALEVTGAQKGYLFLKDDRTNKIQIQARKNINNTDTAAADTYLAEIVDATLQTGQPVITGNAGEDERFKDHPAVINHSLKSILSVPIKRSNEVKGVCYLDNPLSSNVFTEEDREVLDVIMSQAAISIENAKLYKMAITDGLTGLYTHKHFQFLLQQEIERSARYRREFCLILLDLDHFRYINNTYGHQAGDLLLIQIADTIKSTIRSSDFPCRYGGEEFTIILPETSLAGAITIAEKIRQAVAETVVEYDGVKLKVTVSLGVAAFPQHATGRKSLIKAADAAMYRSKLKGKNRVTAWEPQV
jgi:diguanylate cyclase (GGDEF)-like protein